MAADVPLRYDDSCTSSYGVRTWTNQWKRRTSILNKEFPRPYFIHNTIEMQNPRCNIELGNNRFVHAGLRMERWNPHWYQKMELPQWEKIPTRKGIIHPFQRWKMLLDSFRLLDQLFSENRQNKSHLGGNVFVTIHPNNVCVDIRQHNWLPPNQSNVVLTKKGITLRPTEYA
jgi:hypothetical protein